MVSRVGFPDTRWSVIGRLAQQPGEAGVLIDLYADPIARYLRLKFPGESSSGDFDDVIQEVLIHLFERPDLMAEAKPGAGSRFRYLLMTLAWNAARNAVRERRRRQHRELSTDADLVEDQNAAPATVDTDRMERAWAEALLAAAWLDVRRWAGDGTLEADVPRLLEEHLVHGRDLRSLALELGLPLTTCHRRLAKGRTFLQKAIVDRLRQAGEITEQDDGSAACDLLLSLLTRG